MEKHIVITGANEGIGYFMAEEFLRKGNAVTVLDLETDRLAKLQKAYGDRLLPLVCDVRDPEQVKQCVGKAVQRFETIDAAIHNACRCTFEAMEAAGEESYREVMEVNFFGALRLAKSTMPYMNSGGRVVFTSSGVGVTGFNHISPYASSKGAIEALAKCLEIEYGEKGVSFHLFHPPLTRTKSAELLGVPQEFLADPGKVGAGLARKAFQNKFVICHSFPQRLQIRLCYLFPVRMGRMMSRMMRRARGEAGV